MGLKRSAAIGIVPLVARGLALQGGGLDAQRLSIDLPEHDIERANDRRDVCKHVAAAQEVHRL